MYINEDTALTYSAVFDAIRIISETVAMLPLTVHRRTSNGNSEQTPNNPIQALLNNPNDEMTGFQWRQTMQAHTLNYGNGYSEILRDRSNRPSKLQLITPPRVEKYRSKVDNKLVYEVSNSGSANSYISFENMYHSYGLGYDGLTGYSVVGMAARSIGLGMAAEQFGASFFENGAQLGGVIEGAPGKKYDEGAITEILTSFNNRHKGVANHFGVEFLDDDMKYKEIGINQKDAQFLETRAFQVPEIARWFRLPPHKLAHLDNATFSNIEHENINFVNDSILPWCVRSEHQYNAMLFGRNNSTHYVKHNLNALLRGDTETRGAFYREMMNIGVFTINDILELEDRNKIGADGNKRFMQMNMTTIDKIGEDKEPAQPLAPIVDQSQTKELVEDELKNFTSSVARTINHKKLRDNELNIYLKKRTNSLTNKLYSLGKLINKDVKVVEFCENLHLRLSLHHEQETKPADHVQIAADFIEHCVRQKIDR